MEREFTRKLKVALLTPLLMVGFESGNQRILDETKKGIRLEQSEAFAKNAKKLGLKVFGCFMIGLTGDDRESMGIATFATKIFL